jgi:polysaccharide export outer membrane protein
MAALGGHAADRLPDAPSGPSASSALASPAGAALVPPDYRLGPEDVVEISVWREDTLKGQYLVRPDGYISFPLAGEVLAEGRLASEIRDDVLDKLKKYLSDPVVSVTVVRIAAQKVYVIGRVNKPGEYVSGRYIDIMQALSMAGGLTPFAAANDIRVMRKAPGGRQEVIPFRYNDVVKGRNLEQNIILKPGDVVVVP